VTPSRSTAHKSPYLAALFLAGTVGGTTALGGATSGLAAVVSTTGMLLTTRPATLFARIKALGVALVMGSTATLLPASTVLPPSSALSSTGLASSGGCLTAVTVGLGEICFGVTLPGATLTPVVGGAVFGCVTEGTLPLTCILI
jgi:hypothetical protein